MRKIRKTKQGAASFYIVAFSTLILMIIAMSFAAVIISEVTRTANDDLSQSAYDSAMAGVEDAKLAITSYKNCLAQGASAAKPSKNDPLNCAHIIWYMENPDCDMVGHILGRIQAGETGEVQVKESRDNGNNMQQAYTCVKIDISPGSYRGTLSEANMMRTVRVKLDGGVKADDIKKVKISWFKNTNANLGTTNFDSKNGKVAFKPLNLEKASAPPTISIAMAQTVDGFRVSDFDTTHGDTTSGTTDRGLIYLVPVGDIKGPDSTRQSVASASGQGQGYIGTTGNNIGKGAFLKSNNKVNKNLPYGIYCEKNSEYMCTATIELPDPVGSPAKKRSDDTFMFTVALPYGTPKTDFALEFYCADNYMCYHEVIKEENADGTISTIEKDVSKVSLKDIQAEIDSTGRANDMYRRVLTTVQSMDSFSLSVMGPLQLTGNGTTLEKNYTVVCERNFANPNVLLGCQNADDEEFDSDVEYNDYDENDIDFGPGEEIDIEGSEEDLEVEDYEDDDSEGDIIEDEEDTDTEETGADEEDCVDDCD